jgi:hypothetical protein
LSTNPNGDQQPKGIRGKVKIIVRVGKMVINPGTMIIMGSRIIMLERERKKGIR